MKATITKIDGNKIEFIEDGKKETTTAELENWVKTDYVKLGDAGITVKDGKIAFISMNQSTPAKPGASAPAKKTGKWEDDMVTFEDLLKKAHELKEQFSIKTTMIEVNLEKKYALFKATVEVGQRSKVGEMIVEPRIYEGHGDATEENVTGEFIKPHFIRMAETRAIVRALRWYTNNGCAEEEK